VVGQHATALNLLHEAVVGKKRMQWVPAHEKLMLRLVELCVELKKPKLSREALHAYKTICHNTMNTNMPPQLQSLEIVVRHLLNLAEAKLEQSQVKADKIVSDLEDLDAIETPESIMMSSVTADDTKDRTDRQEVSPWLRFLWETYRGTLEVVRYNTKLEALYQTTAQQAFQFCLKYQRKSEFRRLCEILRTHFLNLAKYSGAKDAISLRCAPLKPPAFINVCSQ